MSQPLKAIDEYTHNGCWFDGVGHATITTKRLLDTAHYVDCVEVMSTCSQDMVPINGTECIVREVQYTTREK